MTGGVHAVTAILNFTHLCATPAVPQQWRRHALHRCLSKKSGISSRHFMGKGMSVSFMTMTAMNCRVMRSS